MYIPALHYFNAVYRLHKAAAQKGVYKIPAYHTTLSTDNNQLCICFTALCSARNDHKESIILLICPNDLCRIMSKFNKKAI